MLGGLDLMVADTEPLFTAPTSANLLLHLLFYADAVITVHCHDTNRQHMLLFQAAGDSTASTDTALAPSQGQLYSHHQSLQSHA